MVHKALPSLAGLWRLSFCSHSSAGLMAESTVIQGPGLSQQELLGRMPLPKLWNQCKSGLWHPPVCLSAATQTSSTNRANAETKEKSMKEPSASSFFSHILLALADLMTWATFTSLYIYRSLMRTAAFPCSGGQRDSAVTWVLINLWKQDMRRWREGN